MNKGYSLLTAAMISAAAALPFGSAFAGDRQYHSTNTTVNARIGNLEDAAERYTDAIAIYENQVRELKKRLDSVETDPKKDKEKIIEEKAGIYSAAADLEWRISGIYEEKGNRLNEIAEVCEEKETARKEAQETKETAKKYRESAKIDYKVAADIYVQGNDEQKKKAAEANLKSGAVAKAAADTR